MSTQKHPVRVKVKKDLFGPPPDFWKQPLSQDDEALIEAAVRNGEDRFVATQRRRLAIWDGMKKAGADKPAVIIKADSLVSVLCTYGVNDQFLFVENDQGVQARIDRKDTEPAE